MYLLKILGLLGLSAGVLLATHRRFVQSHFAMLREWVLRRRARKKGDKHVA
jgi:hypothetical protein